MTTTLVLVRHGETDWNREHRFQGHADNPLNEEGRTQSRDVAERLVAERLLALYTSPLRRALETATIVGERLGRHPRERAHARDRRRLLGGADAGRGESALPDQ